MESESSPVQAWCSYDSEAQSTLDQMPSDRPTHTPPFTHQMTEYGDEIYESFVELLGCDGGNAGAGDEEKEPGAECGPVKQASAGKQNPYDRAIDVAGAEANTRVRITESLVTSLGEFVRKDFSPYVNYTTSKAHAYASMADLEANFAREMKRDWNEEFQSVYDQDVKSHADMKAKREELEKLSDDFARFAMEIGHVIVCDKSVTEENRIIKPMREQKGCVCMFCVRCECVLFWDVCVFTNAI
jgi:hypothetical protein